MYNTHNNINAKHRLKALPCHQNDEEIKGNESHHDFL